MVGVCWEGFVFAFDGCFEPCCEFRFWCLFLFGDGWCGWEFAGDLSG